MSKKNQIHLYPCVGLHNERCNGTVHHRYAGDIRWCPAAIDALGGESELAKFVWEHMTTPQRIGILSSDGGTTWANLERLGMIAQTRNDRRMPNRVVTRCGEAVRDYGRTLPPPKKSKPSPSRSHNAVALAWKAGRKLDGGNMSTDGRRLWSYSLVIGKTRRDGKKVVYEYTDRAGAGVSGSTTAHVSRAMSVADVVAKAPAART